MTAWQTDICDTERLTLTALERLFELYKRPVIMETHELAVTFELAEDVLEPAVEDVQAPTHTRVWQDLVCLTGSLARMGYFTTRSDFNHNGRKWFVKCRRNKASYLPPKQSIWAWAE